MSSSEETIRRFLEGDEDSFGRLVSQWEASVYGFAWRYLGNREDAQDVVQETFFSIYRSLRTLRDPKCFPAWLYRIALNHCRGHWRSRPPDLSLEDSSGEGEDDDRGVIGTTQGADLEDSIEIRDLLSRALSGVSEDQRAAIILKEHVGLKLEEVAEAMGCPLSTAKSRLYHGLRGVQRNLKRMGVRF
jgi:RNA polymerase sigma-70 factor, ECF subfamily